MTIIWLMYGSWDIECNRQNFLSFWTIFCPFNPSDNQMMYGSWDMKHDRQNRTAWQKSVTVWQKSMTVWQKSVTVWQNSVTEPLTTQKVKILKNWKNHVEISSFYISVPKIMIISYTIPEIWCVTDVIVIFHFGLFFALLPPTPPKDKNCAIQSSFLNSIIE